MAEVTPINVEKALKGVDYPASKQQLMDHARNSGENNGEIMNMLDKLPDREYKSPVEVNKEVRYSE